VASTPTVNKKENVMDINVVQYPVGSQVVVTESAGDGWETWPVGTTGTLREVESPTYSGQAAYRVEVGNESHWVRRVVSVANSEDEVWKRGFTQAAHAYADRAGWSSEFDDFMEQHGLPRRQRLRNYRVEIDVPVRFGLDVEAVNMVAAREQALAKVRDTAVSADEVDRFWVRLPAHVHSTREVGI
jgi:hypothetical protein